MSVVLPPPVALPHPPGDPADLTAAVEDLAGAGFAVGVVSAHLRGPAAVAPGWVGADAAAAAAQVGTTAAVVAAVHDALGTASALIGGHAELVGAARARITVLREEQQHGFDAAERQLALLVDPAAQVSSAVDPPGAQAVVDAVTAAEADRAVEHRGLLAEVADDVAAVGGQLGVTAGGFGGGHPGPGAAAEVTLHLATVLPGHGEAVLLSLGWHVAAELSAAGTGAEVLAVAQRRRTELADPVVAGALLVALGADGLARLVHQAVGDAELAGALAVALAASTLAGTRVPGAAPLLAGVLDPDDPDGEPDQVALGMGAVLSAPEATPELAGVWLPALLAREAVQGLRSVDRTPSAGGDPVATAVEVLVTGGRTDQAVTVLTDPATAAQLLARRWTDEGRQLAELVALAGDDPAGGAVVTAALAAVGGHLLPGGDHVVPVDRQTWAAVAPTLTDVAVAHVEVLVGPLGAPGADGSTAVLAGATLVAADPVVRARLAAAVQAALGPGSGVAPQVAASVTGAWVAVEDRAVRLAWATTVAEEVERSAVATGYADLAYLPLQALPRWWSEGAQVGLDVLAWWADADGELDLPPDTGVAFGPAGAVGRALASIGPQEGVVVASLAGYTATTGLLALPEPDVVIWTPMEADPIDSVIEGDRGLPGR